MEFKIDLKTFALLFIRENMPRNTTSAKQPDKKYNAGASALRLIASLLFLFVIFIGTNMGWWSGWVTSGVGAVWLPLLFGVAVLSSIGLFFCSLASIAWKMGGGAMAMKIMILSSFSLVVLTASPAWSVGFWIVILGFLIGWFASAMDMM